jgi:hypothetical protein
VNVTPLKPLDQFDVTLQDCYTRFVIVHIKISRFRSRGMFCLQELIDGSILKHLK